MPDITKCLTDTCVKRMACYRWTSPADSLQSYSRFEPKDCKYYIEDLHKVPKSGPLCKEILTQIAALEAGRRYEQNNDRSQRSI